METSLLGFISITKSAWIDACSTSLYGDELIHFFNISPSFLLMSKEGILIPALVPSSPKTTFLISSFSISSIIKASAPPYFSTFLVWVTKEQSLWSIKKNGDKFKSGSLLNTSVNVLFGLHPVGFSLLKYNLPNYNQNMLSYSNLNFPYRLILISYLPMFDHKEYVQN